MSSAGIQVLIKLASLIIKEHFGDIVQNVCSLLLEKGEQSFHQIIEQRNSLEEDEVKRSITLLLQHNCISSRISDLHGDANASSKPVKRIIYYEARLYNILQRIRFSRFILITKELIGNEGELIIEEFLKYGQLTMNQAIDQAIQLAMKVSLSCDISNVREKLSSTFQVMTKKKFLVNVDREEDISSTITYSNATQKVTDTISSKVEGSNKNNSLNETAIDKEDLFLPQILWRVNYETLNHSIKNEACISLAREKFGDFAGKAIRAAFEMTESTIDLKSRQRSVSSSFSVERLLEYLLQKEEVSRIDTINKDSVELRSMNSSSVASLFERMCEGQIQFLSKCHTSKILDCASNDNPFSYALDLAKMNDALKAKVIESIIHHKFDPLSARIFRLILNKKHLDQKQISSIALIPLKETRERLNKMFASGYLHVQEMPRTQDHAPARTFYLYCVHLDLLNDLLVYEMYQAIWNVKSRLEFHRKEAKSLIDKWQQTQDRSDMVLSEKEKVDLERIQKIQTHLETSILQIDESLVFLQ